MAASLRKRTSELQPLFLPFYSIPEFVELGRRSHIVRLSTAHAERLALLEVPPLGCAVVVRIIPATLRCPFEDRLAILSVVLASALRIVGALRVVLASLVTGCAVLRVEFPASRAFAFAPCL